MPKLNGSDIAAALSEESGISKAAANTYVKFVFDHIRQHVEDGDEIHIQSFGNFKMNVTPPRTGRNIHTRETVKIPAKNKIKFTMSRTLDQLYNKKGPDDGAERSR